MLSLLALKAVMVVIVKVRVVALLRVVTTQKAKVAGKGLKNKNGYASSKD